MHAALLGSMALLVSTASAEELEDRAMPKDNLAVGMRKAQEAKRARGEGRRIGNLCVLG